MGHYQRKAQLIQITNHTAHFSGVQNQLMKRWVCRICSFLGLGHQQVIRFGYLFRFQFSIR